MAHAKANIGATNYAVSIMAGHHQPSADERAESLLLSRAEVEEGADSLQQLALSTDVFRSARCHASLQYIQAAPD
jgi:hypothetical protein